jgi:FkbM family methyltransferase
MQDRKAIVRIEDPTGGDICLHVRAGTVDECVVREDYQRGRFFPKHYSPRPDAVILDIGAHIGTFALIASRRAATGTIHALEPDASNFSLLTRNIRLNRAANVVAHELALAGENGARRLFLGEGTWEHSLGPAQVRPVCASVYVEAITLERFFEREAIVSVDLMKMNIEGAEYEVLLTAPDHVVRRIDVMLVEYHPSVAHSGPELARRLASLGYSVSIETSKVDSRKGWITANRGSDHRA